jgi:hypothetical protein
MKQTKRKPGDMHWIVMYYNFNAKQFQPYDVLKYKEDFIKKLKKKVVSKEEFADKIRSEMMYYFWSKCEWEILLTNNNNRIIMSPWVGPENITLDVTNREDFDWADFFDKQAEHYIDKTTIKIDIYDQLKYRWNDFVDYCWNFHHKWQRKKMASAT